MPPDQLERLCEQAHATAHGDITASAIDGLMLGDAFVKCVIGDPKVQAYARCVYSEFGVPFPSSPAVSQLYGPPVIREGNKWPVILDAGDLCSDFVRVASRGEWPYRDFSDWMSESSPLFHATQSLADRHRVFFDLLRNSDVIVKGTSEATGATVSVQSDQWSRPDRYLDVSLGDFVVVDGPWSLRRMVSGLKVSLPAGSNSEATRRVKGLPTPTGLTASEPQAAQATADVRMPPDAADRIPLESAPRPTSAMRSTLKAKSDCKRWLIAMMRENPAKRTKTQTQALKEAREKWPDLSERQFLSAWAGAVEVTGSSWSNPGAPAKSMRSK